MPEITYSACQDLRSPRSHLYDRLQDSYFMRRAKSFNDGSHSTKQATFLRPIPIWKVPQWNFLIDSIFWYVYLSWSIYIFLPLKNYMHLSIRKKTTSNNIHAVDNNGGVVHLALPLIDFFNHLQHKVWVLRNIGLLWPKLALKLFQNSLFIRLL